MKAFETERSLLQDIRNTYVNKHERIAEFGWETFRQANDLGYGEFLESIVGAGREEGYHNVLESVCSNTFEQIKSARKIINTYPFGEKTNEIYGQLFCVCSGKDSFKQSLAYISSYCRKMVEQNIYSDSGIRSVVLVTDKWDTEVFRKYETEFLNYSLNESIVMLFYLFTDYGYMQIPFVDQDMTKWNGTTFNYEEAKYDLTQLPKINTLIFNIERNTTWNPAGKKTTELVIDFTKKSYYLDGEKRKLSSAEAERTLKVIGRAESAGLLISAGNPGFDCIVRKTLVIIDNDANTNTAIWYNDGGSDIKEIRDLFANLEHYMQ